MPELITKCLIKPFSRCVFFKAAYCSVGATFSLLPLSDHNINQPTGEKNTHSLGLILTLHNEVDVGEAGLVVGLEGAGVGALVGHLHLTDVDREVAAVVIEQRHSLVERPLVSAREHDVGAVQPGLVGHFLVDLTSEKDKGQ